jgi:hypothetical protein
VPAALPPASPPAVPQGLGKTLQTISLLSYLKFERGVQVSLMGRISAAHVLAHLVGFGSIMCTALCLQGAFATQASGQVCHGTHGSSLQAVCEEGAADGPACLSLPLLAATPAGSTPGGGAAVCALLLDG